jgi:methylated-DNA-[protein]-cysteine S-methyltransferase
VDFLTDEVPSAVGLIVIAVRDERLVSLDFGDCRGRMLGGLAARYGPARLKRARDPFGVSHRINAYLAGDLGAVDDILVEPGGTPFQRDVWTALRRVPAGTTVTYAQLARTVGRPAASRAVGAANGRNPVSIVIPCHRMIGSDGSLTGYGGGLHRKRWLLEHEGAIPPATDADVCAGARRPLAARPA